MIKENTDKAVAVDQSYFWRRMDTCPIGMKVQLISRWGIACYGTYKGKDAYWIGWAPLPNKPEWMTQ